jgi:hypothetical protein
MGIVAIFFKLSMAVRDLHNHLVDTVGIPSWASYTMFAAVTLTLGCILGFVSCQTINWDKNKFLLRLLYASLITSSPLEHTLRK